VLSVGFVQRIYLEESALRVSQFPVGDTHGKFEVKKN
jgi:hypothetical protein